MKIISPLPRKRGRLEIIPLIDIMFFLLAAFMVVSINKIKVDSLKINLPTNVPSQIHETKEDFVSISIDPEGQVQIGKTLITSKDMLDQQLDALYATNHDQKILISGDRETRNGDMMQLLAKIRLAGFQKVAFAIKREAAPSGGEVQPNAQGSVLPPAESSAPTPGSTTPPAPPPAPGATTPPAAPPAPAAAPNPAAPAAAPAPAQAPAAAPTPAPAPATH
jgi:biopolymer transport protein ExbD